MAQLGIEERVFLLKSFYETKNATETVRRFQVQFPDVVTPNPTTVSLLNLN